ncbi:MAG: hemerythrin domain-containing protein [Alistipes putredinis]|nr:MAG: hemerythrin domain-containing protein [Alistipes putredinis]
MKTDYRLLPVLSRLGIKLGFGDINVGQMCLRYGISPDLFLLICRVYSQYDYEPSCEHLGKTDLRDIMSYLHSSHAYYSEVAIPRLSARIDALMQSCSKEHHRVLARFFADYCAEVGNHFAYEEKYGFPLCRSGVGRQKCRRRLPHRDFRGQSQRHRREVERPEKNIIVKYLPESCPSEPAFRGSARDIPVGGGFVQTYADRERGAHTSGPKNRERER